MAWLWIIVGWFVVLVNFTLLWVMLCKIRDADRREQRAIELQAEAIECAELLREIAVLSCMQEHYGTAQAWANTMGDLRIKVETRMHRFDGDE